MEKKRIQYDCPCVQIVEVYNSVPLAKSTSSEILIVGKSKMFFDEDEDSVVVNNDSTETKLQYWDDED